MSVGDVLSNIWLFAGMDKERLEKLATFTFSKHLSAGEVIFEEGQTGNGLYVIISGRVEVVQGMHSDKPRRLVTLNQGEFFGEMALLDDLPRSASVRALDDTTCVGIDRWLFPTQIRKDPQIAVTMLQTMARRLRETDARLFVE